MEGNPRVLWEFKLEALLPVGVGVAGGKRRGRAVLRKESGRESRARDRKR